MGKHSIENALCANESNAEPMQRVTVGMLEALATDGARRMIMAALEMEVEEYIEKTRHIRDEKGHAMVVRNGKAQERTVQLAVGPISVKAPVLATADGALGLWAAVAQVFPETKEQRCYKPELRACFTTLCVRLIAQAPMKPYTALPETMRIAIPKQ